MDWGKIKHFKESEFACKHCGKCEMDEEFMQRLDSAREDAGIPFVINSGYRCPEYDRSIGGAGNHSVGKAADIRIPNSSNAWFLVISSLIKTGFTRIGISQDSSFIHVDSCDERDGKNPMRLWFY